MATKELNDITALFFEDCNVDIFVDTNMVMLKDDFWKVDSCLEILRQIMSRHIDVEIIKNWCVEQGFSLKINGKVILE